jgi:hypothetical protein
MYHVVNIQHTSSFPSRLFPRVNTWFKPRRFILGNSYSNGTTEGPVLSPQNQANHLIMWSVYQKMSVLWISLWISRLEVGNHYKPGSQVTYPNSVELGKPPTILVTISTGRNAIERLKLRLVCMNTTWKYSEARAEGRIQDIPLGFLNTG